MRSAVDLSSTADREKQNICKQLKRVLVGMKETGSSRVYIRYPLVRAPGIAFAGALALLILLVMSGATQAATFEVTNTNDSGPGSLRQAITDANANAEADTIDITATGTIQLQNTLPDLSTDVQITGPGRDQLTVRGQRDAGVYYRIFLVRSGAEVSISGVTVANGGGDTVTTGGGILNNGTLALTSATVSGNGGPTGITTGDNTFTNSGGGIYNNGALTLTGSVVVGNAAENYGGGIANSSNGTVELSDSDVSNNHVNTWYGGGVYNNTGSIIVTGGNVSFNTTGSGGGGIFNSDTLVLTGSTVSDNTAGRSGGGIDNRATSDATITDSTVSGNRTDTFGGGIYNYGGTLALTRSMVSGNTAVDFYGGGVYNADAGSFAGSFEITNSTVSGNTAGTDGGGIYNTTELSISHATINDNGTPRPGANVYNGGALTSKSSVVANARDGKANCRNAGTGFTSVSEGGNLEYPGTSCGFTATGDIQDRDPLLGPLQDNGGPTETHALQSGSPAIDAAVAGCPPPATDQRGVTRPQGAGCDTGAFEKEAPTVEITPASKDFGDRKVGSRSTQTFIVGNAGALALDVSRVSITGGDSDQFAKTRNECSGASVAPGAGCEVDVRFRPTSVGEKSARLRVESNAASSPDNVPLSGTGVAGPGECTLIGTGGDDTLRGTPGEDVICGFGGDDTIYGGGGDDVVKGGGGNDTVYGQGGGDRLYGHIGEDLIYGQNGDDTIYGQGGGDRLYGQNGDDVLLGGAGRDVLIGKKHNDVLRGGPGPDRLVGGSWRDRLLGGGGNDVLIGGEHADWLIDRSGRDRLYGGPRNDYLNVRDNRGRDLANGGTGRDTCRADRGDVRRSCP